MTEDLITVPEAARRYGLSPRSIQRLHARGLLSLQKQIGERATLVHAVELEEAITRRTPRGRPRRRPQLISAGIPPLVARLDALREEIMQGRRFEGCTADLINEARDERVADLIGEARSQRGAGS